MREGESGKERKIEKSKFIFWNLHSSRIAKLGSVLLGSKYMYTHYGMIVVDYIVAIQGIQCFTEIVPLQPC